MTSTAIVVLTHSLVGIAGYCLAHRAAIASFFAGVAPYLTPIGGLFKSKK